jgi:hypothetical protein
MFMGTECEQLLEGGSTSSEDLIGTWVLVRQTGASQDVCDGETLEYQNSTTALLKCPSRPQITRNYTASNGVLTYTVSGVSYNYLIRNENGTTKLDLTGRNVSRNLYYNKVITTEDFDKIEGTPSGKTSSEPVN